MHLLVTSATVAGLGLCVYLLLKAQARHAALERLLKGLGAALKEAEAAAGSRARALEAHAEAAAARLQPRLVAAEREVGALAEEFERERRRRREAAGVEAARLDRIEADLAGLIEAQRAGVGEHGRLAAALAEGERHAAARLEEALGRIRERDAALTTALGAEARAREAADQALARGLEALEAGLAARLEPRAQGALEPTPPAAPTAPPATPPSRFPPGGEPSDQGPSAGLGQGALPAPARAGAPRAGADPLADSRAAPAGAGARARGAQEDLGERWIFLVLALLLGLALLANTIRSGG